MDKKTVQAKVDKWNDEYMKLDKELDLGDLSSSAYEAEVGYTPS